jgi:Tfp pilus assembly protein PilF
MLQLQGRYAEALALADTAIASDPGCGEAWLVRGDSLTNSGRPLKALENYDRAVGNPRTVIDALARRGSALRALGQLEAALQSFDALLALRPDAADIRFQRGRLRLAFGDFERGWGDFEARWSSPQFLAGSRGVTPAALVPALALAPSPDSLAGRRVMLLGEQGLGDEVMFASIIPDLARTAASVAYVCDPRLVRLFRASFPGMVVEDPRTARIDSDDIDVVLAAGSLAAAFRRHPDAFPRQAYLSPSPQARTAWATRLGPRDGRLRVGLSWRGGVAVTGRLTRSLDLEQLRPILDVPGCEFISVQYGDVAAEIAAVNRAGGAQVRAFDPSLSHDFDDFAGLIANLDVLVSVQTAAVHVAGAIGVDCLALLPENPEWRYGRQGSGMPWYGAVRLLRQASPGAWAGVIDQAATALASRRSEPA